MCNHLNSGAFVREIAVVFARIHSGSGEREELG